MELRTQSHHLARRTPDWRVAVIAGLAAGVIFLLLEVLATWILGTSPWVPLQMTAAIVMGHSVVSLQPTFDLGITLVALVVHFALSVIFGLVLAAIMALFRFVSSIGMAALAGAIFGLVVYGLAFNGMTRVFPWFGDARGAASLVTHLVFGLVVAITYMKLERKLDNRVTTPAKR
ncbi:hypothetical protein Tamer19_38070 [Cupriavidus sp. TA19]|uniref:hypothetical protein n=1 Tax=unclassified Cupriavidus TaxID=2640874 RepID=UPI000E2FE838|nr:MULTISPECIES: hypothetical protein [unclassified Cupriavidus]BDB29707.1 sodium/proton-translocating pyrophosphatase [Cupriavidus sp. P-10]GLC94399.1 hypothetical protein Tamer19_38070 [Cupriavidus sp. TA19]